VVTKWLTIKLVTLTVLIVGVVTVTHTCWGFGYPRNTRGGLEVVMEHRQVVFVTTVTPSAYTGKYYVPWHENIRRCIVRRESKGSYVVVNPRSGAAGAYQFLPRTGDAAAVMIGRPELVGVSASKWSRYVQDKAFWRVWNRGKGRSHWGGGC
jgi:hypothetical protein